MDKLTGSTIIAEPITHGSTRQDSGSCCCSLVETKAVAVEPSPLYLLARSWSRGNNGIQFI